MHARQEVKLLDAYSVAFDLHNEEREREREGAGSRRLKPLDAALTVHLPGRVVESRLERATLYPIRKHMPRNNAIKPEGGWRTIN